MKSASGVRWSSGLEDQEASAPTRERGVWARAGRLVVGLLGGTAGLLLLIVLTGLVFRVLSPGTSGPWGLFVYYVLQLLRPFMDRRGCPPDLTCE